MRNSTSKKIIAVTGGIGSGKTLATKFLKQAGYKVVSCDKIAEKLYGEKRIKEKIREIFPSAVKGRVRLKADKKEIARLAFSDKEKLKSLNALLHPLIMETAISRAKKSRKELSFVEVPLLFESNSENLFDGVIVIMRDKVKRIESVKSRSGLTEEEVLSRMAAQCDYESGDFSEYTVIVNDGDKEKFRQSVLKAIEKL